MSSQKHIEKVELIAFDADDTLWVNEPRFRSAEEEFAKILRPHINGANSIDRLFETEMRNLNIFGYGAKGFMLSMIETAVELTEGKIRGNEIQKIIDLGKEVLNYPIELLDGIEEVLVKLKPHYQLMILTKGDLFDQEGKIARSGLASHFDHVEIVSEKNEDIYQQVLKRYDLDPRNFLMVGNSLKSDVLPVLNIGGNAIYVPFHTTWQHELVNDPKVMERDIAEIENISGVLNFLKH